MRADQGFELDLDSLGKVLGPAGLHAFLDEAIIQPVLKQEAGAMARQEKIGAEANQDAAISRGGLFAVEERFDAFAFHDIIQQEGVENMGEEELVKDLRRKVPSVIVRSKPRSASIIVPATKYTKIVPVKPVANVKVAPRHNVRPVIVTKRGGCAA